MVVNPPENLPRKRGKRRSKLQKELTSIINGTSTKSLEQQEKYINDIANKNYNDADLNALLVQATQKVKKAFAERETIRQQQIDEAKRPCLTCCKIKTTNQQMKWKEN